ncbi:MAG TPA: hypothetical protein DCO79_08745 [Spirochaeta sp.]|nr:hypothetical protein [Spirochaeta sp.]
MNKKVLFIVIVLICTLLPVLESAAQSINNVQVPSSVKWKKLDTPHFTMIFPEELEPKAVEIAASLEKYYPADEYSLDTETQRWPVIINNSLVFPNAYVQGAPRHSQLYTIPSQEGFIGTANWLESIWSHELRHIVQNDKMLRGFTAFAHWLAGEYGSSAMPHFAVPNWLWEGDAVLTETLLSSGGRGRIAGFEREMRTDLLTGTRFNYYKASLGYYSSYREPVPSWYVMGYHLCAYIRTEYGIDAFNRILEMSADFSFTPLILNIAVKQVTGKQIEEIYDDCLDDLERLWSSQLQNRQITPVETVKDAGGHEYTNYYPLGVFDDNDTAALKTSAADIYSLIKIDSSGKEKLLRRIAPLDKNISFNGSVFCWTEVKKDIRWGNLSWSGIRVYNPETGEYRKVTGKTRYLSPSISPDGKLIAAVEITPELDSFIVVIDAESGELIDRFAEPAGAYPSQTCWSSDGTGIVYLRQFDWMESIRLLSPDNRKNLALTAPSTFNISSPAVIGEWVYYVSEQSGLESIHKVKLSGSEEGIVISRPFGAVAPAGGSERLLFADYGEAGFTIASIPLESAEKAAVVPTVSDHVDYFDGLQEQEAWAGMSGPGKSIDSNEEDKTTDFEITDYNKAAGLVNFHSRSITNSNSGTGIAVSLQADDILNNSTGSIYAGWDPVQSEFMTGAAGAWAGFFPVLLYGFEAQTPLAGFGTSLSSNIFSGIWLPMDFSGGIINHTLSIQEIMLIESSLFSGEHVLASQAFLNWSLSRKSAKRDIFPPFGISVSTIWYYSIMPAFYNHLSAEAKIFIPGFFPSHGIKLGLSADYNLESSAGNLPPGQVPRGYLTSGFDVPLMAGLSLDYSLPLVYPDLAIGGFMYIPRIYVNGFIDAAVSWIPEPAVYSTTGMEFFIDFHLFNNSVPLRAGFRFIYDLKDGSMRIEDTTLLLGIDIL